MYVLCVIFPYKVVVVSDSIYLSSTRSIRQCFYKQKRWQAVSLVDGQLRESLMKNETNRIAAENSQKRCRRKLFGLF